MLVSQDQLSFSNLLPTTYEGVKATQSTELSAREYSLNEIRKAREKSAKEKQLQVKNQLGKDKNEQYDGVDQDDQYKEQITTETTISEDLTEGQSASLDAHLQLLRGNDLVLFLPSDGLEEEEVHLIEQNSNNALQDYQMQLMLLEQQNKKRLLMARQEQDHVVSGRVPLGTNPTFQTDFQASYLKRLSAFETMRTQMDSGPAKKQRPDSPGRDQFDHSARSDLKGSHFEILYMISCSESTGCHPVPAFRDAPILDPVSNVNSQSTRLHLNGMIPVFDLETLMLDEFDGVGFVVIRTVQCSEASVLMMQAGQPLRWTEELYIKSRVAKDAFDEFATCHFNPSQSDDNDLLLNYRRAPITQYERNRVVPANLFLFHHRSLLRSYCVTHPDSASHVEPFHDYLIARHEDDYEKAERLFSDSLTNQSQISKLFKPNDVIVSGTLGKPAAFVLHDWPEVTPEGWINLTCWSLQNDGTGFARKRDLLQIPPLGSTVQKINQLPAYPLRFADVDVRNAILNRGKKQWELRKATLVTYKGWNVGKDQFFPESRFMIDNIIYRKMHESARAFRFEKPNVTHKFDKMLPYLTTDEEPPEYAFLLMQPDIPGFYLNEKKWIKLFIENIHPVDWNYRAYDRLVLPAQTKDLVRALVTVRTSQKGVKHGLGVAGKRTDITGGKGNGLIMLLHGGPGTGKMLTAESVAEIAEMPLYRVTCGDIGTNAEAVEKYLNTVLHLGKVWNCVLLLDEADVFLEERSMADLERNSLVSVFLRILEYYDGIMILTSNRVGTFDEAFKSRIQVALHYQNLNRSARKSIWQNFFEMLEEDEEDVDFDELRFHLDELAGKEMNGRQIRNVLTTARQLAMHREQRLDWKHLAQALSVSFEFTDYVKRMQGHSDDQRARDVGLR